MFCLAPIVVEIVGQIKALHLSGTIVAADDWMHVKIFEYPNSTWHGKRIVIPCGFAVFQRDDIIMTMLAIILVMDVINRHIFIIGHLGVIMGHRHDIAEKPRL